ncbi:RNA 2',3'-cyclic phosphodiesterase [Candidatus Parcubacteria bacterium]|uniref:RNA 2',3'-cyclic phosphodiesterase n=1 Tax=Candidatus Sungiibacteriota bacterium TaxID=2750080 RepID=A0A932YW28_9BACT|nr:RNA 2',3'-cyclic phosphodiesterase [Candidatus Parcubacteria bacterium]MBI4132466.1 RNA 2',3'-cyclic phosphodiesterase [Candidatus Sungbacteria bacterium]
MLHRLFFAINIPDDIRTELVKYQEKWRRYPVRWTKPENLHFTALFLGNVDDEQLIILRQKARGMLNSFRPFALKLTEITLGPPQGLANMVWATAVADPEPAAADLSDALFQIARAAKIAPPNETRPLQLHLTLGRAKGPHLKGVPIAATLEAAFAVDCVDLMESTLREDGPRYRVVASYNLYENIRTRRCG